MSSLEKRIERWRESLAQSETITDADIDELENHLREEIGVLQQTGLSEQEAFLVAHYRLGETPQLEEEFAKVDGSRRVMEHLSLMAMGVLLLLLATCITNGISRGGVWVASLCDLHGYALGAVGAALKVVTVLGLLLLGRLFLGYCAHAKPPGRPKDISVPQVLLFFVALVLLVGATIGGQLLFNVLTVRSLGSADYGRACLVLSCSDLAWTILTPVLAGVVFVTARVHIQRHRGTFADG